MKHSRKLGGSILVPHTVQFGYGHCTRVILKVWDQFSLHIIRLKSDESFPASLIHKSNHLRFMIRLLRKSLRVYCRCRHQNFHFSCTLKSVLWNLKPTQNNIFNRMHASCSGSTFQFFQCKFASNSLIVTVQIHLGTVLIQLVKL